MTPAIGNRLPAAAGGTVLVRMVVCFLAPTTITIGVAMAVFMSAAGNLQLDRYT